MFLSLGLERDKFDNKTVTFEEHIKVEHNMWHYLFFIVLVKVKDSTEYTGPESYVAEMIRVRQTFRNVDTLAEHRFGIHTVHTNTSSFFRSPTVLEQKSITHLQANVCWLMQPPSLPFQLTLLFLFFTSSVSDHLAKIM